MKLAPISRATFWLMGTKGGHDLESLLDQKADIEQKLASLERQIYLIFITFKALANKTNKAQNKPIA